MPESVYISTGLLPSLHTDRLKPSQSQNYVTTDSQSASLSWCQAPIWVLRPDFYYCQIVAGLLMWSALSLTRERACRLHLLLVLASVVIFRSESRGRPGPLIYIPQEQGDPVIPPGIRLGWNKVEVTLRLTVIRSLSLGVEPHQIFITLIQLWSCLRGAPSLMIGRVCLLYMLLALVSAVFLGSESLGTRDHMLQSQIRDFPFVASYDSQGHGGDIRPRLHTGTCLVKIDTVKCLIYS
jgi:hypothetical protein